MRLFERQVPRRLRTRPGTAQRPGIRNPGVLLLAAFLVGSGTSASLAQTCIPQPANVASWWTGDTDAGDLRGGNGGTLLNGAAVGPGFVDQAFHIDGVNDYVNVGDQANLDFGASGDFTIDAWIRSAGAPHIQNIVDKRATGPPRGYLISLNVSGRVSAFVGDGSATVQIASLTSGLDDGTFHHVAVVCDRDGLLTIYLDGAEDASASMSSIGSVSNSGSFTIGRGNVNNPTSVHQAFQGAIDELRVFRRALTPGEIAAIHAAGSAGVCKGIGAPIVPPDLEVSLFAENTDTSRGLFHISFDSNGVLYSGATKSGDDVAPVPIVRISADGTTVSSHGPPIADPDGVAVDRTGSVATSGPNSVLVGSAESVVQLDPAGLSTSTLLTIPGANIQQMAFDSAGRLFLADASTAGRLGKVENGTLTVLASLGVGVGGIALDEQNARIFVSAFGQGTVKALDANGTLIDGDFVAGLSQPDALALDSVGALGSALFVADRANGSVVRVDPLTGASDVFAYNLFFPIGLAFDAGGDLYVVDGREIWRISAAKGSVSGRVVADCPQPGTGLLGVVVDAYAVGTGTLSGSDTTDVDGSYAIPDLAPGDYVTSIVTPLGYTATSEEAEVTVVGGEDVEVGYGLECLVVSGDARGSGFWKHQVAVAAGGPGHGQIDGDTLCGYLDLIAMHFNSNAINEVAVYVPPLSGECADKIDVAEDLLNLRGNVGALARARQHLLALLFNVAAQYVSLTEVISDDGATVSQAVTFCDNLIDDPGGDHHLAKSVAATINGGRMVAAGVIPLDTANISYAPRRPAGLPLRVSPNPRTDGEIAFTFGLGSAGPATLEVFNVAGRKVRTVLSGPVEPGARRVVWNGRADGRPLGAGVYFARLTTPEGSQTVKFVQLGN